MDFALFRVTIGKVLLVFKLSDTADVSIEDVNRSNTIRL